MTHYPILDVEGQDRGELLHREREVAPDAAGLSDQASGIGRDADAGHQRDQGGGLADDGGVEPATPSGDDPREPPGLRCAQEVPTPRLELLADGPSEWGVDYHGLLGGVERAVVETLAGQDVPRGLANVRRTLDEHRNVSGFDAEGGLPGGVRRAHEPGAARRQDHGRVLVLHEGSRALPRGPGHTPQGVWRQALFGGGFA
jgi:hypothetical protein